MGVLSQYFRSAIIFFKPQDKHPYVAYQNEEIKVPLSFELNGIDELTLDGKRDYILKVRQDEQKFVLSDVVDGGEF